MAVLHRHWALAVLWVLSLIVVGVTSSLAQPQRGRVVTEAPTVIFGNDVGFRMERTRDGMAVGKVVVRIDGRWIDTTSQ